MCCQIRDWLQAGQRGEALLMNGETRVRCVLRTSVCWCAAARRRPGARRLNVAGNPFRLPFEPDSVFETLEAQEMLWLLQAVIRPNVRTPCVVRWQRQ